MNKQKEENRKAAKYYDLTIYTRPEGDLNLFKRTGSRRHEVIIGGKENDWDVYCEGYRRAADALVPHLTQEEYSERRDYSTYWESISYTILFLYRHYLELRIKELFIACGGSLDTTKNEHSLSNLWGLFRKKNEEFNQEYGIQSEELSEENVKDIKTAGEIIVQFDNIDKKSQVLRYPIDKRGKVTLDTIQIDMVRIKEMLGWTGQLLDGWSLGIYECWQAELKRRYHERTGS